MRILKDALVALITFSLVFSTGTFAPKTKKKKKSTCGADGIAGYAKEGCGGDPELNSVRIFKHPPQVPKRTREAIS
jgi:hypothetical protein